MLEQAFKDDFLHTEKIDLYYQSSPKQWKSWKLN